MRAKRVHRQKDGLLRAIIVRTSASPGAARDSRPPYDRSVAPETRYVLHRRRGGTGSATGGGRLGGGHLQVGQVPAIGPALAAAVVAVGLLTGCGEPAAPAATEAATASPTPSADPITQCAAQLAYWVNEALRGAPDRGYDYQEMGLSGAKYEALNAILDRMGTAPTGDSKAAAWANEQSRAACVEVAARPTSTVSRGGWP